MAQPAVLFDVGDTLWHSSEAPPAAEFRRIAALRAGEFLKGAGLPHGDAARVARVAWDALEQAMRLARSTDLKEPDYVLAARAALERAGLKLGAKQAEDLMESIYVSGEEAGKVAFPGARETLETLRERGFRLGIVTNRAFGGSRFGADLAATGLDAAWDTVVVSVEVGYLKPHPATFQRALAELELSSNQAVMVGNSLAEDIAGAQQVGMAAAWKRSAPDAEGVVPDYVFDDLPQLLDWDRLRLAAP